MRVDFRAVCQAVIIGIVIVRIRAMCTDLSQISQSIAIGISS